MKSIITAMEKKIANRRPEYYRLLVKLDHLDNGDVVKYDPSDKLYKSIRYKGCSFIPAYSHEFIINNQDKFIELEEAI